MASDPHTDQKFVEKRKPKGEINFKVQLSEEQKECKRIILENTITFVQGKAGSGKTLVSVLVALDLYFKKEIGKIYITRPMVPAGEEIGYLPGDLVEKISPYTAPLFDIMFKCYGKEKIEKMLKDGDMEIIPIPFLRGRNLGDCVTIIDESQNAKKSDLKLLMTRIDKKGKLIVNGDREQIDLKKKIESCFEEAIKRVKGQKNFGTFELLTCHRDPIVEQVLELFHDF